MGKFSAFMKKRGLLLAMGLCVTAAGIAGVGTLNGMIDELGKSGAESTAEPQSTQGNEDAWLTQEIAETPVGKAESGVPKPSSSQPSGASGSGAAAQAESPAAPEPTKAFG